MLTMRSRWFLLATTLGSAGCTGILGSFDVSSNAPGTNDGGATSDAGADSTTPTVTPDAGTDAHDGASDGRTTSDAADAGTADVDTGDAGTDAAPVNPVAIAPASLDFTGYCGQSAAAAQSVTLKNDGTTAVTFTASLDGSGVFTLGGTTTGTVVPGGTATITVTPSEIPTNVSPGDRVTNVLSIDTTDPVLGLVKVPVAISARGARLEFSGSQVDFGDVRVTTMQTSTVTVKNSGNEPLFLTVGAPTSGTPFSIAGSGTQHTLQGGQTLAGGIPITFAPTAAGLVRAEATLTQTGPLCNGSEPVLTSLAMLGTGSTATVNVSPGELDFTSTDCGGQAAPLSFTITNSSTASVSFDARITANADFYDLDTAGSDNAQGTLAGGAARTIMVIPGSLPKVLGAGDFSESRFASVVEVRTAPTGGGPQSTKNIALKQTARGLVLEQPSSIDFGDVTLGRYSAITTGNLVNVGNVAAILDVTTTGPFVVNANVAVGLGSPGRPGTGPFGASFGPLGPGTVAGVATLSVPQGTPVCMTTLPTLGFKGNGVCPVASKTARITPPSATQTTFDIEVNEVTRAQYLCTMADIRPGGGSGSCGFNTDYTPSIPWPPASVEELRLPVSGVDWCDAKDYCAAHRRTLCGRIPGRVILPGSGLAFADAGDPAQSEWSAACSNLGTTTFPYGNTYVSRQCNVDRVAADPAAVTAYRHCVTSNDVYDLVGNVAEWENSCSADTGSGDACRARGGFFGSPDTDGVCGATTGNAAKRGTRSEAIGIRCCE
ncbi:MAG: choice-of-anchor D domain-containing protein [Polyangiaceae bacterium]